MFWRWRKASRNRPWVGLPDDYAGWVEGRYAAAAEMILAMPRSNFRMANAMNLASRLAATDPAAALDFAWNLGPLYFEKISGIALGRWLQADAAAAREYIDAHALPSVRARLGPTTAAALASENPSSAAQWVEANLSGHARIQALSAVVRSSASSAPAEAMAIAESLPEGPAKHEVFRDLAQAWFSKDVPSAAAWASRLGATYRSAAIEGIERASLPAGEKAQALSLLQAEWE